MQCKNCKKYIPDNELIEAIQRASNDVFHIRGECPYCRSYVKFVSFADSYLVKKLIFLSYKRRPIEEILDCAVIYDEKLKEIY